MTSTRIALHAELRALSERYAVAVDRRDADLFASAFAPDAELFVHRPGDTAGPSRLSGHAELRTVIDNIRRYTVTMHFLGQTVFEVSDQGATGDVYCVAHHLRQRGDTRTNSVMYIRYEDSYRNDDGAWLIGTRHVRCAWTETRTADTPRVPSA